MLFEIPPRGADGLCEFCSAAFSCGELQVYVDECGNHMIRAKPGPMAPFGSTPEVGRPYMPQFMEYDDSVQVGQVIDSALERIWQSPRSGK